MKDKELLKLLDESDKYVAYMQIRSREFKKDIDDSKKRLEEIDKQFKILL